eukprot:GEMP01008871.1.p1 GENE.GEMP01008871.1~~GEMP01008871.1.p1  ORF type:complete len:781 (+),score=159.73 GEMP01008871.1:231-2573(+)
MVDTTPRSVPLCTLTIEGGPASHISPCRQGPLMLAAGRQLLSLIQLKRNPKGSLASPYVDAFEFEVVRNLQSRLKLSNTAVAYHPQNGSIAATASSTGVVCIWNVRTKQVSPLHCKWTAHTRSINSMAFFPHQGHHMGLLTAFADGAFKHWLVTDPTSPGYLRQHGFTSGQNLKKRPYDNASTDSDGGAKAYDDMTDLRTERASRTPIRDLHVRKVGSKINILCAQEDGRVILQEVGQGVRTEHMAVKHSYHVSAHAVYSVRFCNANDDVFCAASRDKHLRIFDCRQPSDFPVANIVTGSPVACARWRPESSMILASSAGIMDHNLLVWDMRRLHLPCAVFNSHKKGGTVSDFFWASKDHIISCGKDSTVRLHALQNAHEPLRWAPLVSQSWSTSCVAVANQTIERRANLAETLPSAWFDILGKFDGEVSFERDLGRRESKSDSFKQEKHERKLEKYYEKHNKLPEEREKSPSELPGKMPEKSPEETYLAAINGVGVVRRRAYLFKLPWNQRSFASAAAARGFVGDSSLSLFEQCEDWAAWCKTHDFESQRHCWELLASLQARVCEKDENWKVDFSTHERSIGGTGDGGSACEARNIANVWMIGWRNETVVNLVKAFEEANDVGMCLLLANMFDLPAMQPEEQWEAKILDWSHSLVAFLARSKQFIDRALFIKNCAMEEIRELSHFVLNINCAQCLALFDGKQSDNARQFCPRCQEAKAICGVCGEKCGGLWSTCQMCGHGGHIRHLHEWFKENTQCPAGCGHACTVTAKVGCVGTHGTR